MSKNESDVKENVKSEEKVTNAKKLVDKPKEEVKSVKTLSNTDSNGAKKNVADIQFWGNGDAFKLICKASSKAEKWMKSTKAMEIPGVGCVVQVTTQQGDNVAEAAVFVPACKIQENVNDSGEVISRELVSFMG